MKAKDIIKEHDNGYPLLVAKFGRKINVVDMAISSKWEDQTEFLLLEVIAEYLDNCEQDDIKKFKKKVNNVIEDAIWSEGF